MQWTAVWPKGQGFRISPMPSQTGPVWQIAPVGQARIQQFTNLKQLLDPIPDDYFRYFKQGFFCYCYLASPDPKVRARFAEEKRLWMESLNLAVSQGSREDDDWTFVPNQCICYGYGSGLQQSVQSVLAVWTLVILMILKDLYELRGTEGRTRTTLINALS